jgi:polyhydroxybutyrate depolymerase
MTNMKLLVLAVCLAVLLTACGGRLNDHRNATADHASVAKRALLSASTGCGVARAAGTTEATLKFGGLDRTYRLTVPRQVDGTTPLPLVLNFHGLGGNALQIERYTRIVEYADRYGFIAATVDGTGEPRQWTLVRNGAVDDAGFVRELIDVLSGELCIDPQRIYAMGISDGAFFTSTLACDLNDRLAAVAVVAGEPFVAPRCAGKAPMPVLAFHGTGDTIVPFEGGFGSLNGVRFRGARDNVKDWSRYNGCAPELQSQRIAPDVLLESYEGCRSGADVQLYVIEDGGHTWPGASEVRPNGSTTQSIDATELMLQFFLAHPKP